MILNNFKFKFNIKKIFIVFCFFFCWFSLSTSVEDYLAIKDLDNFNFFKVANFLRFSAMYLIFPILLFLNLYLSFKKNFQNNYIFLILISYFIFQIPGLIITENDLSNISFIISALNIIILTNLFGFFFSDKEKNIFIYVSLFFLCLVFLFSIAPNFPGFLSGKNNLYGGYLKNSDFFLDKTTPRSSGLARSALIIIVIFEIIFSNCSKKFNIIKNLIQLTLTTFILLLQSRTMLLLLLLYLLIIFFLKYKFSLKNLIKHFFISILIPTIITLFLLDYSGSKRRMQTDGNYLSNFKDNVNLQIRGMPNVGFTSGRMNDWIKLSKEIKKHYLIGAGSQADRFLINQTASNGILYAISSSGFVGFVFYLIFSIIIFFKSIKILFWNKTRNRANDLFSFLILMILARSLLETSYAVFSIDLIILITSINFINKNEIKTK